MGPVATFYCRAVTVYLFELLGSMCKASPTKRRPLMAFWLVTGASLGNTFSRGCIKQSCYNCEPCWNKEEQWLAIIQFFKISSVHFCCICLRIGYESHAKLGLKTNLSRWNSKEIELSLQNIVEKTYKQETTTDLNPKSVLAALNVLPTNKKRGR